MLSKQKNLYSLGIIGLSFLTSTMLTVLPAHSQGANSSNNTEVETTEDNDLNTVTQADTLLSLDGAQKLMKEAQEAINGGNYDLAATKLKQARRIFNQLSNFYLQLGQSFSGIDNRISESQRVGALRTAALRDEATYQLALVHRAQNQPDLAIPLLIQIIRSQNPTSELGRKSYQQLYEIGFVDAPFESSSNNK
jgi:thioredoxin-like negative regulator of GroEL